MIELPNYNIVDYFDECATQIECPSLVAFGIHVDSRMGIYSEIIQMLNFAHAAAISRVAHYIERCFYDSKNNLCFVAVLDVVKIQDPVGQEIILCADKTLAQYEAFGIIGHCENFEAMILGTPCEP